MIHSTPAIRIEPDFAQLASWGQTLRQFIEMQVEVVETVMVLARILDHSQIEVGKRTGIKTHRINTLWSGAQRPDVWEVSSLVDYIEWAAGSSDDTEEVPDATDDVSELASDEQIGLSPEAVERMRATFAEAGVKFDEELPADFAAEAASAGITLDEIDGASDEEWAANAPEL